jgi:hypothetical protein
VKTLFAVMLLLTVARVWAQESDPIAVLREACVSEERVAVAKDANDYSHLKDSDWASSGFCVGLIKGFEMGADHTIYVLSEPKRLEFISPLPKVRQLAKAVVTFIDEHPAEIDPRSIFLGAFTKQGAVMMLGNIVVTDATPDCPKQAKDIPPGGCNAQK